MKFVTDNLTKFSDKTLQNVCQDHKLKNPIFLRVILAMMVGIFISKRQKKLESFPLANSDE